MEKFRIYEIARMLGVESCELLTRLDALGIGAMTASNMLDSSKIASLLHDVANDGITDIPPDMLRFINIPVQQSRKAISASSRRPSNQPALNATPENIKLVLERAQNGDLILLSEGIFKGPLQITRAVTLAGTGRDTLILSGNEPAVEVTVPGVRIESLAIERVNGGAVGEVALQSYPGTAPVLWDVYLIGSAPGSRIEGAEWSLPEQIDIGKLLTNRVQESEVHLQVALECKVTSNSPVVMLTPTYLPPGKSVLRLQLHAVDALPGTHLNVTILLHDSAGRTHSVPVLAEFASSVVERYAKPVQPLEEPYDGGIWGISFEQKAARNFVTKVNGDTAFNDCRNEAVSLLQELFSYEAALFYVRKRGQGQKPDQQRWDLTLATDRPGYPLSALMIRKNQTLKLEGVVDPDGERGYFILGAVLVDLFQGNKDGFALPLLINFESQYPQRTGIPADTLDYIEPWPDCTEQFIPSELISLWERHQQIELSLAKARQFCVPYVKQNVGAYARQITFKIIPEEATITFSDETPLGFEMFWERGLAARNENIKLVDGKKEQKNEDLGRVDRIDAKACTIRIRLHDEIMERIEQGTLIIPPKGWLLFDAFGNINEVERKGEALRELKEGKTQNPYLSSFFFDPTEARLPEISVRLQDDQLLDPTRVNDEQRRAVEKVMASDDLALIQGPPGTGKTTVIAEICYQVAQEGKRTLIASQTHLAVDNAMSRLSHHPIIRALRWGKADKVEDEGKPYLRDRVISTWLKDTATDCQRELDRRRSNVGLFQKLLADEKRFGTYLQMEEQTDASIRKHWEQVQELSEELSVENQSIADEELESVKIGELRNCLDALCCQETIVWDAPEIIGIQHQIAPFISSVRMVTKYQKELAKATETFGKRGVQIPQLPLLAQANHIQGHAVRLRQEFREVALRCDDAASHVATMRSRLCRIAELEAKIQAEQQLLSDLEANKKQSASRQAELEEEFAQLNQLHQEVLPLSVKGDNIDWDTPQVVAIQVQLINCLSEEPSFVKFVTLFNRAAALINRLEMDIPDLPLLSRAAYCVRHLSELINHNNEAVRQLDVLHKLNIDAQRILEDIDRKLLIIKGEKDSLEGKRSSLESLSEQENALTKHDNALNQLHDDLTHWTSKVRAASENLISLITDGATISTEMIPPFPGNLQQDVTNKLNDKAPWIDAWNQLISSLNKLGEIHRQRISTGDMLNKMRQALRDARNIIGRDRKEPNPLPRSVKREPLPDNLLVAMAVMERDVKDFVIRLRRPLTMMEKAGEMMGGCRRRSEEAAELEVLEAKIATLGERQPAVQMDSLIRIVEDFLSCVIIQVNDELSLQRGCLRAEFDDIKRQQETVTGEMEDIIARIKVEDPLFASLRQSLGIPILQIEQFLAGNEWLSKGFPHQQIRSTDAVKAFQLHLQKVTEDTNQWNRDLQEIHECQERFHLGSLLGIASAQLQSRLSILDVERTVLQQTLVAVTSRISATIVVIADLQGVLDADKSVLAENQPCTLAKHQPFDCLIRSENLASLLLTELQNEEDVIILNQGITRYRREIGKILEEVESAFAQATSVTSGEVLSVALKQIDLQAGKISELLGNRRKRRDDELLPAIAKAESNIKRAESLLSEERTWWCSVWKAVPARLQNALPGENIYAPAFLRQIKMQFKAWRTELDKEGSYLNRYDKLVSEWIDRLKKPSERDAADLQGIYLANANVVGITCSQAAAWNFTKEFPGFDVVIIDEVSKCTPPELLMPALKGKKIVLVGDHRQLPPMIKDKTLTDLARECDLSKNDQDALKRSIFKSHYERADEALKQDLQVQYRMHPHIMWGINQFYRDRLRCGIVDADSQRAHGLAGKVLKDEHHIVWVTTPINQECREQQEDNSTSYYNPKEIEIIEELCLQMDNSWARSVEQGLPPKEIAIITFYNLQLRKIQEKIVPGKYSNLNIRTGTVDRFQGMERPVVIASLVRNNTKGDIGFAKEPERVNVAFSRAQELLVIVGARELFSNVILDEPYYLRISDHVRRCGGLMNVSDVLG